jgi:2-hydroxymuconate-semialdehyde hydrolase/2-hydroxy-6-oxo-octa-2,4-dienoate hydrolase
MTISPVAAHTVDAQGIKTSYLGAGIGQPVIMLHGSGPGVSALANWQHYIPALSQQFSVLAPDIVGFGGTERPNDISYSLRTWAEHVWAFLDAHGVEKPRSSATRRVIASRRRWTPTGRTGSPRWC